jgi:hypothetical protein
MIEPPKRCATPSNCSSFFGSRGSINNYVQFSDALLAANRWSKV